MGNHHTWEGVPVPPQARLPPQEVNEERMPQENNGKVVTRQPTSKASLGWKNGKLQLGSWTSTRASTEGWVKTTGKVIWLQTSGGTHI